MDPSTRRRAALFAVFVLFVGSILVRRVRSLTVYAHRGFASVAPENTVEAVEAVDGRADGVEVDVRRCGSGELVCVHDADLERIAGVPAQVADLDVAQLRDCRVGAADACVATLAGVLAAVPDDCRVVVECKERGLIEDVLAAVDDADVDAVISSFDPTVLATARATDASIPLAFTIREDPARALAVATALECEAIHPRLDLCLRTLLVPRAHRQGLEVVAWTIDSGRGAILAAIAGADGVFADRPVVGVHRENRRSDGKAGQ